MSKTVYYRNVSFKYLRKLFVLTPVLSIGYQNLIYKREICIQFAFTKWKIDIDIDIVKYKRY
jgi:hypothetical protein